MAKLLPAIFFMVAMMAHLAWSQGVMVTPTSPSPEHLTVIRETVLMPAPRETAGAALVAPVVPVAGSSVATLDTSAPPANILNTLGKLKALRPLVTYFVHHPIRFIIALAPKLARAAYAIVGWLLRLLRWLAMTFAVRPAHVIGSTLVRPLVPIANLILALTPVWIFLLGAVLVGVVIGVFVGLTTGESTRQAIIAAEAIGARLWAPRITDAGASEPGRDMQAAVWEKISVQAGRSTARARNGSEIVGGRARRARDVRAA